MYFGEHRDVVKDDGEESDYEGDFSNNNSNSYTAAENWPSFDGNNRNGDSGSSSPPSQARGRPHHRQAFMQSLLDLQGFCVESQRSKRRQQNKSNAENNCICLLHQILIKVVIVTAPTGLMNEMDLREFIKAEEEETEKRKRTTVKAQ